MEQGRVTLTVGWHSATRRIAAVTIGNSRPAAARLLVGRSIGEATALSPRLFSLCSAAQGVAARLALAAAEGRPAAAGDNELRAVASEAIGEHLWRLLLDWPALLGRSPEMPVFVGWRRRLQSATTLSEVAGLAADLRAWLESFSPPNIGDEHARAPALPFLPWRTAGDWAAVDIDETFSQLPTLRGQAAETGALARQSEIPEVRSLLLAGRRVAARLSARRADLERLVDALTDPGALAGWLDAAHVAPGVGLARVETARGLLLHLTQVKDGRVAGYVIVAPTEWNFHPQGAFAGELVGSPAPTRADADMLARRLALVLDPCVSYEVRVEDA